MSLTFVLPLRKLTFLINMGPTEKNCLQEIYLHRVFSKGKHLTLKKTRKCQKYPNILYQQGSSVNMCVYKIVLNGYRLVTLPSHLPQEKGLQAHRNS